jgi:hypothetical protein
VLDALRAGWGAAATDPAGWHGFARDDVAAALWGVPADALDPPAAAALDRLWQPTVCPPDRKE